MSKYDMDAIVKGDLLVGNEGVVKAVDYERRFTSRGIEDNRPVGERLCSSPIINLIASYADAVPRANYRDQK